MPTFGPVEFFPEKCTTKSSALCSNTLGWIYKSWCETKLDPLCEGTGGAVGFKPGILKWAGDISKKYNIAYNLVLALVLGFTGIMAFKSWQTFKSKNPNLTSEELITKIVKEQFGKSAEIIINALKEILAPLNDTFKDEVEKEQPYLKGNKVFDDLIKAGIEEKKEKILGKFAALLLTPDNKKTVETQAEAAKSTKQAQAGNAAGGMQESALTDGLKLALKSMMNAAGEALRVISTMPSIPGEIRITDGISLKP